MVAVWITLVIAAGAVAGLIPGVVADARHVGPAKAIRLMALFVVALALPALGEWIVGVPGLAELVVAGFGGAMWMVALIWAVAAPPAPAAPVRPPKGYRGATVLSMDAVTATHPSAADGPGRYKVIGVDRATKMDTVWHCQAESAANAKVKAELEGIVVTLLERA